ncbi:MAG TPA: CHASE3 domain-containing protein, partial [Candidatus Paceibacterota bacterium]|nr:CHASE3 domain-containing protein [Candidatus Paceibacterota bacterium]
MKNSVENKIVLGFAASVLALVGIGWISYRTTTNLVGAENWVSHTYQVIATLESGRAILTDVETAQRGYLLTGDASFLEDCTNAQAQVDAWINKLRNSISDNPGQLQRLEKLEPLISQRLAVLNDRIRLRQQQGLQAADNSV